VIGAVLVTGRSRQSVGTCDVLVKDRLLVVVHVQESKELINKEVERHCLDFWMTQESV